MWSSCLRIDRSALVRVLSMDSRHKRGRKQGDQLGGYCSPAGGILEEERSEWDSGYIFKIEQAGFAKGWNV